MKHRVLIALVTGVLAGALALGCSGDGRDPDRGSERSLTQLPDPSGRELGELGEPLMIALAQAKNYHHKSDIYLREGKLEQAIESVQHILSITFPAGAPEAGDVALDARARLAKLLVAQGKTTEAMQVVDEGITSSKRRSFFLANLYTVKGEVYEAIANLLDEDESESAKAAAGAARRAAIEALDQSIGINTELQRALMGEALP